MSNKLDRSAPPSPAAVRAFRFPEIRRSTLDNGLAVLSAKHGEMPLVAVELVLDAGATADPAERTGLALLTGNLLDSGTESRSADRIAWALESLGVHFSVDTGWDATIVRIVAPREQIQPAVRLFAELVRRPSFPSTEFERLRNEQLADILQRQKEPRALANDMALRFIYPPDVAYSRPLVGTSESVHAITRHEVLGFYAANYRPSGASLLFVGDILPKEAQDLARAHFGDWPAGSAPKAPLTVHGMVDSTTVFVVDRPGSVQSELRVGAIGLARNTHDYFPLIVMNSILGGAFTSRLNMNLREKQGFTYGVRSNYSLRKSAGPFLISTAVATEVTARALDETLKEVNGLRDNGATDAEVTSNRDYLAGVLPLELHTIEQLAGRLADLVVYDLPDNYFESYPRNIMSVSVDDVNRAAREHLHPERFAIVIVGDAEKIVSEVEALGVGPVQVHRSEDDGQG